MSKNTPIKPLIALFCALIGISSNAAPLKLSLVMSDSNGNSFGAQIVFDEGYAYEYGVELSDQPYTIFDLAANSWTDGESANRITLSQAQAWAEASRTKSRKTIEQITDPSERAFTEELLWPTFAVSSSLETIHLKSHSISYSASEPLQIDSATRNQIFAYDVLNAYRKAMVLRKAPPFPQLEVTRILREKGVFPGLLTMDLSTPNGSVRVTIRYSLSALTPDEEAKIKKLKEAREQRSIEAKRA